MAGFQAPRVLLEGSECRERLSNRRLEVCELTSTSLSVPGLKAQGRLTMAPYKKGPANS